MGAFEVFWNLHGLKYSFSIDKNQQEIPWLLFKTLTDLLTFSLSLQVAERLNVDVRRGLSWREANDRMNFVGPNEFQVKEQEPLWKKYIEQFQNPLILLLLGEWTL